ncbi:MAG TPA: glucose 1-dehydrogenase [Acidimicrobiales bacterium]|nr:glucose 1-dehydrogenase [Acidimicrobiales bacterium]
MTNRLKGKVALISGGARGMGESHARRFVAEGANVVISDVLDEEGATVAKDLGDAAAYVHLDVTDEGQWNDAVTTTTDRFGHLDVLVNNAGIVHVMPMAMTTVEDFRRVVDINQIGVFLGMKAAVPALAATKNGSIINISSVAGLIGAQGHIAYCASKWAVRGMTKVAALELASLGVRVNSIHPGLIDTPMFDEYRKLGIDEAAGASVPIGRLAEADDVSELALYLASDESRYSTGSEFVVDGGMTAGPVGR